MPDDAPGSADRSEGPASNGRLDSWKEIAAYLKRDVTTVRRWEKRQGLPVHRHLHERRDSVYAYTREIDTWWEGRRNQLAGNGALNGVPEARGEGDEPSSAATTPPLRDRGGRLAWVLGGSFGAATLLAVWLLDPRPQAGATPDIDVQFSLFPPAKTSFGSVSVSPDERQLAFTAATPDGNSLLWVRPLDSISARSLPDTEGALFPFWAPASDAVGFFAGGKLWTIDLAGGRPRLVSEAPDGRGGTWNRDGIIVFAPGREGPLFRVPASGGAPVAMTDVDRQQERGHLWPEFLPDGNHLLYLADSHTPENHHLFVSTLDGSVRRRLFPLASNASFLPEGYLVFVRDRQLMAQPFDADRLEATGEPRLVVDQVQQQSAYNHKGDFSVSRSGVLVYRTMQSPATRLIWRDRAQPLSALISTPAEYYEPALSPDETRVAVARFDPELSKRFGYGIVGVRSDIWMVDRTTGLASQFTTDPAADWGPVWSPDGRTLVFSSNRGGSLALYRTNTTGESREEVVLASAGMNPIAQSWSPDGRFIVYSAYDPTTHTDLWLLPMTGDRTPQPLVQTAFSEDQAEISPDGRWFTYASNETGRDEVYVQSFPIPAAKYRISAGGAADPRWRADGKEIFFIGNDRRLMAASVRQGVTFEHGPPVTLFDTGVPPHWYEARNLYDVSRDGSFLFMTPIEDDRSSPFTVVINWTKRLRQY